MASGINIIGLDITRAEYKKLPDNLKAGVRMALQAGAATFHRNAQRDAPVSKQILHGTKDGTYGGTLKNQITFNQIDELSYQVVSGARYSPYLEWGTITKVNVPAELQGYAIQFKGKGIRKTGGIIPQPFFFKHMPIVRKQIENDINQALGR